MTAGAAICRKQKSRQGASARPPFSLRTWPRRRVTSQGHKHVAARRTLLPLLAALLASPAAAQPPASPPEPWYSGVRCEKEEPSPSDPLPVGLSRQTVLRDLLARPLVRSADQVEFVCQTLSKLWKAQKQPTVVVFLETELYKKNERGWAEPGAHKLHIGVYRPHPDGRHRLVAKSTDDYEFAVDERLGMLDFAPYQLTPSEYAFGVRISLKVLYASGDGTNEWLRVYRLQGKEIVSILSTLVYSRSDTLARNEEGTRDPVVSGRDETAQISVLPHRTEGFFDWKKRLGKRSAVLRWNGNSYQLVGKDPIEDVNYH